MGAGYDQKLRQIQKWLLSDALRPAGDDLTSRAFYLPPTRTVIA